MRLQNLLILSFVLILLTACGQRTHATIGGGSGGSTVMENDQEFDIEQDGVTRHYKVHLPVGYDKTKSYPAVVYLHGGGGSLESAYKDGMDASADSSQFILLVPAGTGPLRTKALTWNGGAWGNDEGQGCCGAALKNNVDDIGFINAMLDEAEGKYAIDSSRVYATGISNGGMLSYRLACEDAARFAAVAPIAPPGVPMNCNPSRPIPIIHVHGTKDPCAPYNGGAGGGCLPGASALDAQSASEMIAEWQGLESCASSAATTFEHGAAKCESYACNSGSEVALCTITGGGHTWPSGNQYLSKEKVGPVSFDMSFDDVFDLLSKHSL